MTQLIGKIAFITGAGRGQGRAHAVTLARAGADIAALDICRNLPYPRYNLASEADLDETVRQVEVEGRTALKLIADVRDLSQMEEAAQQTLDTFDHIDILICNAGVCDMATTWDITETWWDIMVDINLKGCWTAIKCIVPRMIAQNRGGRIILTSSVAGLKGMAGLAHYSAAKWGVVGLAKTLALEVAQYGITVNTLHPTNVDTPLISGMAQAADIPLADFKAAIGQNNLLPVPLVEAQDLANAALWLASDAARYVTGQELKVDAGLMLK